LHTARCETIQRFSIAVRDLSATGRRGNSLSAWHAPQFLVQRGWEFSLKTDHVVNNELFDLAFPLLSSQPALNSFGVR